jgi:polyisoprenoid-binding protein YceI
VAVAVTPAALQGETLKIDPNHSGVGFSVRHMLSRVTGRFHKFEGTIELDEKNLAASKVSATIQAASVDTGAEARDQDLRGLNHFDVEKFPTLAFTSTAISDLQGNKGKIRGKLQLHGVEKEVVLDTEFLGKAKDPWGNQRWGFHATTTVNRKDYGLTWNKVLEGGGFLVGDEIEISLDVEALIPKSAP